MMQKRATIGLCLGMCVFNEYFVNIRPTRKDFKTQKMKNIIFCVHYIYSLQRDGNDTMLLFVINGGVSKDTGHHQLRIAGLLCFALGVPTN